MATPLELEQRLIDAMRPAPGDQLEYDGWLVGLSRDDVKRARSVIAVGPSTLPLEEKVTWCEQRYAERSLPPVFRLTPMSQPPELDAALAARGYVRFEPSDMMASSVKPAVPSLAPGLRFDLPSFANWLAATSVMRGHSEAYVAALLRRLAPNRLEKRGVLVRDGDVPVAAAMLMADDGFAGLYDVYTAPAYRGRGIGTAMCARLMAVGSELGVDTHWLSVLADNGPALAVYRKLGFEFSYQYWYRVRPEDAAG